MSKPCLKYIISLLLFCGLFFAYSTPTHAARTINSATLNGSSSVNVAPSATITANVNVTTTGGGTANDWQSTSWSISGSNCVNHTDHVFSGTFNESFSVTAPATPGTYSISFVAYSNDACSQNPSSTFTMTNSITVTAPPTPTPTPTSTPTTTPTGTATPTPTSGSSSSTTYYPSVVFAGGIPSVTNNSSVFFSGTASVQQENISMVEYSTNDGASWQEASSGDGGYGSSEENFSFTPLLSEGSTTVKVRAKSSAGVYTPSEAYAVHTISIVTTPPSVVLDVFNPNPTRNTQSTISGSAVSRFGTISKMEISLNGGSTFLPIRISGSRFSIRTQILEDGNYEIIARATDNAGNVSTSQPETLIVDTIPPIIGGGSLTLGPQVLGQEKSGEIELVAGVETTVAFSMKGGVTESQIKTGGKSFSLSKLPYSNVWTGKLLFDDPGENSVIIEAIDGAENTTTRQLSTLNVKGFGEITQTSGSPIDNATIEVFYYETVSGQWTSWEAFSYGQTNPQKVNGNGEYSFILPPGKYYLEIKSPGFYTKQSEIFETSQTTIVNYPFELRSKPKIEFNLPFFGKIVLSVPQLTPPDSAKIPETVAEVDSGSTVKKVPSTGYTLLTSDGNEEQIKNFFSQKLLITFISPWSTQSQEQASILSDLSKKLGEEAKILVIFLQESPSSAKSFVQRGNYSFDYLSDKDGLSAKSFGLTLLPYHVFVNRQGTILTTLSGALAESEITKIFSDMP